MERILRMVALIILIELGIAFGSIAAGGHPFRWHIYIPAGATVALLLLLIIAVIVAAGIARIAAGQFSRGELWTVVVVATAVIITLVAGLAWWSWAHLGSIIHTRVSGMWWMLIGIITALVVWPIPRRR